MSISRRELVRMSAALALTRPGRLRAQEGPIPDLRQRVLGRTGRWVTPLGLGGQASLQWTGAGIDAADIIARAIELGVNYLDTANAYGTSQANYGEAFRRLNLAPWQTDYNSGLRERLYVASKTGQRGMTGAVNDLKTSLRVIFGDGRGTIPEGAYLDAFQFHNLTTVQQVQQIFEGIDERRGTLAALLDCRDGTNYTGHNPERKRWTRHLGITGHQSSPVLMEALRRDRYDAIDTMLVALNANDRRYSSHQYNAVALARAKGVGVIAMKAFADGVFYGKPARFSTSAGDVVLSVGRPDAVAPQDLVRYPLGVAGVAALITGIGQINRENAENDQAVANLAAALGDHARPAEMRRIEDDVLAAHGAETNYFNERRSAIAQPANVKAENDGERVKVSWDTALAAGDPLRAYEIWAGENKVAELPFRPQLTSDPLWAWISNEEAARCAVRVIAV
jgi:aryl-alcohol dehydrogenase-like predicted oxidoreductase